MGRYRKKPVEIETMRFDGSPESGAGIMRWARSFGDGGIEYFPFLVDHFRGDPQDCVLHIADPNPYLRVRTLEGTMTASPGDWIIRGVKGEFYPCKPDIFEATYESADENVTVA